MNKFLFAFLLPAVKIAIIPRFPAAYKGLTMDVVKEWEKAHPNQVVTIFTLNKLRRAIK